jgi:hypothetical protein
MDTNSCVAPLGLMTGPPADTAHQQSSAQSACLLVIGSPAPEISAMRVVQPLDAVHDRGKDLQLAVVQRAGINAPLLLMGNRLGYPHFTIGLVPMGT